MKSIILTFTLLLHASSYAADLIEFSSTNEISDSPQLREAILKDIGPKIKILGLGENSHGIEINHHIRYQLIKNLIKDYKFRVLAFESPWYLLKELDDQLQAASDSRNCQFQQSWVSLMGFNSWHSPVLLKDLFIEICNWNSKNPRDRIHVAGFDVQMPNGFDLRYSQAIPIPPLKEDILLATVFKLDKIYQKYSKSSVKDFFSSSCPGEKFLVPREGHYSARPGAKKLLLSCKKNFEIFQKTVPTTKLTSWERFAVLAFKHGLAMNDTNAQSPSWGVEGSGARDLGMAKLTKALYDEVYPNKKILLYAHSGHLAYNQTLRDDYVTQEMKFNQGDQLKKMFGNAYGTIGVLGYKLKKNYGFHLITDPALRDGFLEVELNDRVSTSFAYIPKSSIYMKSSYLLNDFSYYWSKEPQKFRSKLGLHYTSVFFFKESTLMDRLKQIIPDCITPPSENSQIFMSQGEGCEFHRFDLVQTLPQKAWKDKDSRVWEEPILINVDAPTAEIECKKKNMVLPTDQDFFALTQYFGAAYDSTKGYSPQLFYANDGVDCVWAQQSKQNQYMTFSTKTGELKPVTDNTSLCSYQCITPVPTELK